jgi:hypothetical protein
MKKNSPIIILGNPRSGTTLLRLILTSHPDIVIPPECGFFVWWYKKYKNWTKNSLKRRLDGFLDDLFKSRKFETWDLSRRDLRKFIVLKKPNNYTDLISSVYLFFGLSRGKKAKLWGDKNNYYLNHVGEILRIFPNSRFVHIVRDGRDVAVSYKELAKFRINHKYAPNLSSDISSIAHEWRENVIKVRNSLNSVKVGKRIEIRYEDLVTKPQKITKKICDTVNVKFYRKMLNFYEINKKEKLEPDEFLLWKKRIANPINDSRVGVYKHQLNSKEKEIFNSIAKDVLNKYGYNL